MFLVPASWLVAMAAVRGEKRRDEAKKCQCCLQVIPKTFFQQDINTPMFSAICFKMISEISVWLRSVNVHSDAK